MVLLLVVESTVLIEIAARPQASELQDRFGAFQASTSPCDLHSIFDKITSGSFDHDGRDWIAFRQILLCSSARRRVTSRRLDKRIGTPLPSKVRARILPVALTSRAAATRSCW
jgi:hypothetical protein